MNGVTIMSEILCHGNDLLSLIVGLLFVLLLSAFFILGLYQVVKQSKSLKKIASLACIGFIVCTFIFSCWLGIDQYNNTHMEYEIVIDDSVSFNEITSVYDILSRENNVYRVKLLEDSNVYAE